MDACSPCNRKIYIRELKMNSKYDILIFDIFVNQPELAKKVKRIINANGANSANGAKGGKDDKKSEKK